MSKGFDLGDYVEVDERIRRWYEKYPDGRIATIGKPEPVQIGNAWFIVVTAAAYRTPDDPQPCIGSAWEPFPGKTTYTKDSEAMNAETSAWGRALVAAGILAKAEKIASREEVRNRQPHPAEKSAPRALNNQPEAGAASVPLPAPPAASLQMDILYALGDQVGFNRLQVDAAHKRYGYDEAKRRLDEKVAALP